MKSIGLSSAERQRWENIWIAEVEEICDSMLAEAMKRREKVMNNIKELLVKSEFLCKELGVEMPPYGADGKSYKEEEKFLVEKIKE